VARMNWCLTNAALHYFAPPGTERNTIMAFRYRAHERLCDEVAPDLILCGRLYTP
jgi:hypothetical protein